MKLKQLPEDFQVEELTDVRPEAKGPFAFYELTKRGLGTQEAVHAIRQRWHIDGLRISYGGLKDRHAVTKQFLTIADGPPRGLKQNHFHLRYLGRLEEPFTSDSVTGNRFHLTLRALAWSQQERISQSLEEVKLDGVANYFDDQRFGSVGPSRQFVARKLIEENYEAALKLALTEPYEFDSAAQKQAKQLLRKRWGRWQEVVADLPRGMARQAIAILAADPADYLGAFARLPMEHKSLYLAAYQSFLWNRILAGWIETQVAADQLISVRLQLGRVPMWRKLSELQQQLLRNAAIPFPSARLRLSAEESRPLDPAISAAIAEVMKQERLPLEEMKLKHFRKPFFSKGDRPALFEAKDLKSSFLADELHEGRVKLTLQFVLPRGSYATMVVKRITSGVGHVGE